MVIILEKVTAAVSKLGLQNFESQESPELNDYNDQFLAYDF